MIQYNTIPKLSNLMRLNQPVATTTTAAATATTRTTTATTVIDGNARADVGGQAMHSYLLPPSRYRGQLWMVESWYISRGSGMY